LGILCEREGARVGAVDRDHASAQATVDILEAEGGHSPCGLGRRRRHQRGDLVARTLDAYGKIDTLHDNVGIGAYKTNKADINAWTQTLAQGGAKYRMRANVIM
jgi:NAD(P)-dependent dehydrogenase (short-subunit alcohol dehydrogenase family)